MIYLELFLGFLQVGMFSIGGGYAAIPLIREQALSHGWLSLAEFTDLVTIAEMTPGPIAVNAATFVGIRTAGIPGALLATLSCILPSLIIVTLLAMLYQKFRKTDAMQVLLSGVRPAVVALIGSAALSILLQVLFGSESIILSDFRIVNGVLFAAALFLIRVKKMSPILVMLMCGAISLVLKIIGVI